MTKPIRKYYVGDAGVSLSLADAFDLAMLLSYDKVDWADYEDDRIVGEGGVCANPDCFCNGSWTHWHDPVQESE